MFRYAQVEAALARLHAIDESGMGALKGVIIHLQRQGLVPANPGRGKRIDYTLENVWLWAVCLELLQFGLDPKIAARAVWSLQATLEKEFAQLPERAEDRVFVFWPAIVTDRIKRETHQFGVSFAFGFDDASNVKLTEAPEGLIPAQRRRVAAINLSALRRELVAALDEAG